MHRKPRTRTLLNGSKVPELKRTHTWEFSSKCPAKWLHIDCEGGACYVRDPRGFWSQPFHDILLSAKIAIGNELKLLG